MKRRGLNRREFIGKTAAGVFSAGLGLPLLKGNSLPQKTTEEIPTREPRDGHLRTAGF
ncbi:MAG: twin-arginine translocation signal domain-containing protein [Candidatus Aminicenantaceae bacterium]